MAVKFILNLRGVMFSKRTAECNKKISSSNSKCDQKVFRLFQLFSLFLFCGANGLKVVEISKQICSKKSKQSATETKNYAAPFAEAINMHMRSGRALLLLLATKVVLPAGKSNAELSQLLLLMVLAFANTFQSQDTDAASGRLQAAKTAAQLIRCPVCVARSDSAFAQLLIYKRLQHLNQIEIGLSCCTRHERAVSGHMTTTRSCHQC